jgi:hypothetical protein
LIKFAKASDTHLDFLSKVSTEYPIVHGSFPGVMWTQWVGLCLDDSHYRDLYKVYRALENTPDFWTKTKVLNSQSQTDTYSYKPFMNASFFAESRRITVDLAVPEYDLSVFIKTARSRLTPRSSSKKALV